VKELLDWFSVERLEEIIERAEFWGHGAGYTPCEVIVLARIALAVKQAQPGEWVTYWPDTDDEIFREHSRSNEACARRIAGEIGGYVVPVYYGLPPLDGGD
jgi:hypothetical protein